MTRNAIVTSQKGSWRWQNAFRIATYAPKTLKSGRLVWASVSRSHKLSWPQLKRMKATDRYPLGSLHNKPLTPEEIAEFLTHLLLGE